MILKAESNLSRVLEKSDKIFTRHVGNIILKFYPQIKLLAFVSWRVVICNHVFIQIHSEFHYVTKASLFLPYFNILTYFTFFYTNYTPTQRVAEGIMFLTRQSVSPVFLVSATPLKPPNRISWNFVVMKDIMCRCGYPQEILNPFFFSELRPFWT